MACEQGRAVAPCEVTNHSHIFPQSHYSLVKPQGDIYSLCVSISCPNNTLLCRDSIPSCFASPSNLRPFDWKFVHAQDAGRFFDLRQVPARVVCSRHLSVTSFICLYESVYSHLARTNFWGTGGLTLKHILLFLTLTLRWGF